MLDGVIGLGPNLFYGTELAACILVFRACKPAERQGRVLVIDGSRLFKKGRNQNTLEPEHGEQIFAWYEAYADVDGAARVVPLSKIAANDWNLNIPRYVAPLAQAETVSVADALVDLKNRAGRGVRG